MNSFPVERIRNVGLFSHGSAGKTSLTEALLYLSHTISRQGRVEDGSTTSDWDADEIKRQISISTSVAPLEWRDTKINLLDSPGYADFLGEVKGTMRTCDVALILMDASAGVEVGTEQAWEAADELKRVRALFVNKMDRENANFASTLSAARERFGSAVVPVFVPIGAEKEFRGVVDVLARRAYLFDGANESESDIPAEINDEIETLRTQLVESICENDEELMLRYLEDEAIEVDELLQGLRAGIAAGQLVPVFAGSSTANHGTKQLLDEIVDCFPGPGTTLAKNDKGNDVTLQPDPSGPLAALVFKTVADPYVGKLSYFRVYSGTIKSDSHAFDAQKGHEERVGQLYMVRGKEQIAVGEVTAGDIGAVAKLQTVATGETLCEESNVLILDGIDFPSPAFAAAVHPKTKSDLDKMGSAIQRLLEEDPTLHIRRDDETGETLVSGLGESHVQIGLERMARKFGVNVETELPTVPYRETISVAVKHVEYKHKKQTGGHGQYGHVFLDLEPLEDGDFEFTVKVVGGVVPRGYFPAVEKGVREALDEGILAGFPVSKLRVTLTDGSYHAVDSSEMAFKIAGAQAFKKGAIAAKPIILEPMMHMQVTVTEAHVGDVMSDLNGKRAHVQGMEPHDNGTTTIDSIAPAAEIQRYATDLRSITQGRGSFTTKFSHYQPVPVHLTDVIIATAKARAEAQQAAV